MNKEKMTEICRAAITRFGRLAQVTKAIEELAELQRALARDIPPDAPEAAAVNVHEEIADVEIMLMQLRLLYDLLEINEWKERKLERLARMVGIDDPEGEVREWRG
ncbi:MAG: hypothetical protein IJ769_00775 [Clostridia bacterium]|nr:hypothetical protein [Clostridia bacterium]